MVENCLQAGADAYLAKPFDLKDLTDKIFALLPAEKLPLAASGVNPRL